MKKADQQTLKTNLFFMKKHLKNPADFPALVEDVASITAWFSEKEKGLKKEIPYKKEIKSIRTAIKKLGKDGIAFLAKNGQISADCISALCVQCEAKLLFSGYDSPETDFFKEILAVFYRFTGRDPTFNCKEMEDSGGVFIKFCTVAYRQSGEHPAIRNISPSTIRDRVRKFTPLTWCVIEETLKGGSGKNS